MNRLIQIQGNGTLGAPANVTVHQFGGSSTTVKFGDSVDFLSRIKHERNMGKITKRLMSLRDLLKTAVRIHDLEDGYDIRVMPFAVLPDSQVKDFIQGMGVELKQLRNPGLRNLQKNAEALDGAATLEKLGDVVADVFEVKLEGEKRRSWIRSIIYRPGKFLQYVLGDAFIPESLKSFLAGVHHVERAESEKLTNIRTRLSRLTGLSLEECEARITMILEDRVRFFDDIERMCEYSKSSDNFIVVESGERTLALTDTWDQVLYEPDIPRVIRGIFGMLAHQLRDAYTQGSNRLPHCSALLKTGMKNSFIYKEVITSCASNDEYEFEGVDDAIELLIRQLIRVLKEEYCSDMPTLLRFAIDSEKKTAYVEDALPTNDNLAATKAYLKKKRAIALNNLGEMYYKGRSVKQDYEKARMLFESAAEQDDHLPARAAAQNSLGEMYHRGHGVKQDFKKARKLFELVAEQSDNLLARAAAINSLGEMYYIGDGVKQDYKKAREYFEQVADQTENNEARVMRLE